MERPLWYVERAGVPMPVWAEAGTPAWHEAMDEFDHGSRWQVRTVIPCPGAVHTDVVFDPDTPYGLRSQKIEVAALYVSTVFLGIDHNWGGWRGGRPLLYETMIFNIPGDDEYQLRAYDRWEALLTHTLAVRYARQIASSLVELKSTVEGVTFPGDLTV
jgi:hypothetical protein